VGITLCVLSFAAMRQVLGPTGGIFLSEPGRMTANIGWYCVTCVLVGLIFRKWPSPANPFVAPASVGMGAVFLHLSQAAVQYSVDSPMLHMQQWPGLPWWEGSVLIVGIVLSAYLARRPSTDGAQGGDVFDP